MKKRKLLLVPLVSFFVGSMLTGCSLLGIEKCTVKFEVMEGHVEVKPIEVFKNKTMKKPDLSDVLPSYASVENFVLDHQIFDFNTPITEDITLSAQMKYDYSKVLVWEDNHVDRYTSITGYKQALKDKLLYISDEKIGQYDSTHIATNAFEGCSAIEKLVTPYHVSVGIGAFKDCINLKEAVISDRYVMSGSVLWIKKEMFKGCTSLTTIDIPETVELYINESAFENTGLTKFEHYKAYEIDENAFKDCKKLSEVIIPSVKKIKEGAFSVSEASNLAPSFSLTLASTSRATLKELGEKVFYGRTNLTGEFEINKNEIDFVGNYAFGKTGITKLIIASSSGSESVHSGFQEFWNYKEEGSEETIAVEYRALS
ncbi:MAG: leucine-rich repeat domain-containing protein [Bacilli bacterium]|jgi:hypothetical protein